MSTTVQPIRNVSPHTFEGSTFEKKESCLQNWSLNALIAKVSRQMMKLCQEHRAEQRQQLSKLRSESDQTTDELSDSMKKNARNVMFIQLAGAFVSGAGGATAAFGPSVIPKIPGLANLARDPQQFSKGFGDMTASLGSGVSTIGQTVKEFGSAKQQRLQHRIQTLQSDYDSKSRGMGEIKQVMREFMEGLKEQMRAMAEATRAANVKG